MQYVLADTGLWYALFDSRDSYYAEARAKSEYLDLFQVVLPWPILYETLCTRFVRNTAALGRFESYLKRSHVTYFDDRPYRDAAFDLSLRSSLVRSRPLSLVDCAIRLILDDVNAKIDYLITFNQRDFVDVCHRRRIKLI
jgi:hypothetical protein